ncbi:class D beta-lactamase [Pseudalkalibacillus hwajinpoensis]|uniref:Beta-lactamase n=1 Tax=Guptibacillus hwajinpoensis TaxID=208199 RepID=A0A4U1MNL0_9BACL|nr:class D beta-lactamase [Pseudalkalibacillus hwajinpoensis]TKD72351.1 class D beta-lactamase [Pseudalkalibacillus hwajinpoensis]
MKKYLFFVAILLVIASSSNVTSQASATSSASMKIDHHKIDVPSYFSDHEGTFILRDLKKGKTFIYDEKKANERQTPESTFKVANALIGLQVGAVRDEYDVKRWDGVKREFDIWNQDHTLGSGMRYSVIWYYQDMARDIGATRMEEWLEKLSYGNKDSSGGIDHFWLDSSLEISPLEQVDFIEKLVKEELPMDQTVMKTVKRMMIQEETDDYTLYGKTGTRLSDSGLGWFVGFIETGDRSYVFATKIDGSGSEAKTITTDLLREYGLMSE